MSRFKKLRINAIYLQSAVEEIKLLRGRSISPTKSLRNLRYEKL